MKTRRAGRRQIENRFVDKVREIARAYGWRTYHTRDSRGSEPGFPDLVLCRPPDLWIVEGKRDRKQRPTDEQQAWLDDLALCGVRVAVWTPDDWETIVDLICRRRVRRPIPGPASGRSKKSS